MSAFWQWYAQVNDSIRQSVVEQGWFGREVTPGISAQDMPGLTMESEPAAEPERDAHYALYDATWGEEPQARDLYGEASVDAPVQDEPATEQTERAPEPQIEPEW